MVQREKERERLAFLGALSAHLAHEIRTPLSTIQVTLQLLKEDWSPTTGPKEERARKKVEILLRESKRLEDILNDFLQHAAGYKLHVEETNLNELCEELLDFLAPQAGEGRVQIRKFLDSALPKVHLDRKLLKQAVLNILVNAVQAMPEGGELIVKSSSWKEYAQLEITDTGSGMTPQVQDRIFDVFFSTKKTGTGLGLPTAQRIIREHDGLIHVQSDPGKGSRFTVRLPVRGPTP